MCTLEKPSSKDLYGLEYQKKKPKGYMNYLSFRKCRRVDSGGTDMVMIMAALYFTVTV